VSDETIRRAEPGDVDAIVALVTSAGLPAEGVRDQPGDYFVVVRDARIVGCCGLERYGDDALLRSVAVDDGERGRGTGARLVNHALSTARASGVRSVTLLTTTAEGYFPKFGFRRIDRDAAPPPVRESEEFRTLCPSTAVVMSLELEVP
jgi:amino-acid N-acetyltransferase